ncbi:OmpA family protein [Bacteroides sp.]
MKNKLVILSLLMAGTAVSVSAQEKEKYYSENWKDNIFISVGGGIQSTTNPDTKFGKAITPLINVSLGKWINPIWGFRGQVYGWESKMKLVYPFEIVNGPETKRSENYVGVNLDGMMNLTNLFCGYKPGRVFELNFFIGPSMNVVKNYNNWHIVADESMVPDPNTGGSQIITTINPSKSSAVNHDTRCLIGASLGLGAKFNINPRWAIDLEARGQVTPSILGAYSSAKTDGYIHINAGVSYTFGGKKFVSCGSKVDQSAINDELNKYRDELSQALSDLADAKNALANAEPVVQEIVKEVEVVGPCAVFFQINKAVVDDYGLVNLKLAAKTMKANPDKKYKIAGYADKATGNAKWNQKLSEMRAQAVYDILVNEGVNKAQLEVLPVGGAENMFGKNFLNRVVILE